MKASAFSASPVLDAPQRTVVRPSSPVRTAREPSPTVRRTPVAGLADRHAGALYRPVPPVDVDDDGYPYGDEAPMEGDHHDAARRYASDALETRLKHREDVYVAGDRGLYFQRGSRSALVAPDLLVAFDVRGRGLRNSYKVWEEGKVPDLVLEILSEASWKRDVNAKPDLYRDLGIPEYWILDLLGKLDVPITGRRLTPVGYETVEPDESGRLVSDVLGLELAMVKGEFRFRELTGEVLPSHAELASRTQATERRNAALEAELAALRAQVRQAR